MAWTRSTKHAHNPKLPLIQAIYPIAALHAQGGACNNPRHMALFSVLVVDQRRYLPVSLRRMVEAQEIVCSMLPLRQRFRDKILNQCYPAATKISCTFRAYHVVDTTSSHRKRVVPHGMATLLVIPALTARDHSSFLGFPPPRWPRACVGWVSIGKMRSYG